MSKLQTVTIGLVLAAIAFAALLQVIHVDPIWKLVSIGVVSVVAAMGAVVFFTVAYRDR